MAKSRTTPGSVAFGLARLAQATIGAQPGGGSSGIYRAAGESAEDASNLAAQEYREYIERKQKEKKGKFLGGAGAGVGALALLSPFTLGTTLALIPAAAALGGSVATGDIGGAAEAVIGGAGTVASAGPKAFGHIMTPSAVPVSPTYNASATGGPVAPLATGTGSAAPQGVITPQAMSAAAQTATMAPGTPQFETLGGETSTRMSTATETRGATGVVVPRANQRVLQQPEGQQLMSTGQVPLIPPVNTPGNLAGATDPGQRLIAPASTNPHAVSQSMQQSGGPVDAKRFPVTASTREAAAGGPVDAARFPVAAAMQQAGVAPGNSDLGPNTAADIAAAPGEAAAAPAANPPSTPAGKTSPKIRFADVMEVLQDPNLRGAVSHLASMFPSRTEAPPDVVIPGLRPADKTAIRGEMEARAERDRQAGVEQQRMAMEQTRLGYEGKRVDFEGKQVGIQERAQGEAARHNKAAEATDIEQVGVSRQNAATAEMAATRPNVPEGLLPSWDKINRRWDVAPAPITPYSEAKLEELRGSTAAHKASVAASGASAAESGSRSALLAVQMKLAGLDTKQLSNGTTIITDTLSGTQKTLPADYNLAVSIIRDETAKVGADLAVKQVPEEERKVAMDVYRREMMEPRNQMEEARIRGMKGRPAYEYDPNVQDKSLLILGPKRLPDGTVRALFQAPIIIRNKYGYVVETDPEYLRPGRP